jgi:hypothetical protein
MHLTASIETRRDQPRKQLGNIGLVNFIFQRCRRCETHLARTVPAMRYVNAIMARCLKCSGRESADGYFCFSLEHRIRNRALLMRLMRRTLLSAQCLTGGPFRFLSGRAKCDWRLIRRVVKPTFVGCMEIDSELFHQIGALANAFALWHRLTRLCGLMALTQPC